MFCWNFELEPCHLYQKGSASTKSEIKNKKLISMPLIAQSFNTSVFQTGSHKHRQNKIYIHEQSTIVMNLKEEF